MDKQNILNKVVDFFLLKGFDIIGALVIFAIGYFVAVWLSNLLGKTLEKKQLDPPLRFLMVRVVRLILVAFVLVAVLEKIGVPITPLIAGISVAGLGAGLAMQGVLSNIVAGLTIIFSKPFRVDEYVEIAGVHGQVTSIELLSTTLIHADRSRVVIPNRKIVGEILHNYGTIRQLDLSVGVAYSTNPGAAIAVVHEILAGNPRVLTQPAPAVAISTLGDSAVVIAIKPWVKLDDYGAAAAEINRAVLEIFKERRIEIPFPQREIRLLNGGPNQAG